MYHRILQQRTLTWAACCPVARGRSIAAAAASSSATCAASVASTTPTALGTVSALAPAGPAPAIAFAGAGTSAGPRATPGTIAQQVAQAELAQDLVDDLEQVRGYGGAKGGVLPEGLDISPGPTLHLYEVRVVDLWRPEGHTAKDLDLKVGDFLSCFRNQALEGGWLLGRRGARQTHRKGGNINVLHDGYLKFGRYQIY